MKKNHREPGMILYERNLFKAYDTYVVVEVQYATYRVHIAFKSSQNACQSSYDELTLEYDLW